jgi:ABC-type glycerol-3-phosphate transport system substrate-binding protein
LFAAGSLSGLTYQDNAIKQAGKNDQWTVIPFPSSGSEPAINVYGPSLEVFSSSDARQLASWLFIKWLISTENLTKLTESTGGFPLRASSLEQLTTRGNLLPQWGAAVRLLPVAHPEPAYQSWSIVRWAVSDAATQLFRSYFTSEGIPELVTFLNKTANDLHEDPLKDSQTISATPTPKGTSTPTGVKPTPSDAELLTPTP